MVERPVLRRGSFLLLSTFRRGTKFAAIWLLDYFWFQVADRDTLTSIAARFDTTPSELTKLNRLATPFVFPGQQLYVPLREAAENDSENSTPGEDIHDDLPPEEKGSLFFLLCVCSFSFIRDTKTRIVVEIVFIVVKYFSDRNERKCQRCIIKLLNCFVCSANSSCDSSNIAAASETRSF